MIPDDELTYEGQVETTERTEKELEPLRFMIFRMARVRQHVTMIERGKKQMSKPELNAEIRAVSTDAESVIWETMSIAKDIGQGDVFLGALKDKYWAAPPIYREQIFATFAAVDEFLFANNLVRTVERPEEDVVEVLWQQCLEEHLEKHGTRPAPLDITKLTIFWDVVEDTIYKSVGDRTHATNDEISTWAITAASWEGESERKERLRDIDDFLA